MFIVVECVERKMLAEKVDSKKEAWKIMRNALLYINDGEFKTAYTEDKDNNGFVTEADNYGIDGDSAWANADCGDMNCDWKIFDVEDAPFILAECVEREIFIETYETKEEAWLGMKDALTSINDEEFANQYNEDKEEYEFVECASDYGISEYSAWANADCGDMDCDWEIFETKEI